MSSRVNIDLSDIEGIPPEAMAKLSAINTDRYASRRAVWEPWQEKVLVKMWPVGSQKDVASAIGFCVQTCATKYKELTEG